uniref:Uncharacterized protein MANES_11G103800 n=1 Tax=Rhizophora mucronata TaxID=61149 RepID=A0A2P2JEN9_RHIMU
MGESAEPSFFRKHWEGYKEFWKERFSFLDNYNRFLHKRLPPWSSSDVDAFIAIDPVHGPALKAAREAVPLCVQGSAIGAVSTAFVAWKYSKSLHGVGLSFLAGGVFGWTFGQEFANHWLQLYRMDTLAAQAKYLEWWQKKCEQRS